MIVQIQYLRGVAALMVVVFHAFELVERQTALPNPFKAGAFGVDVFFVISGFIILIAAQKSNPTPIDFVRKRIIRIVPLYWVLTLFIANVALIRPDLLASTIFDGPHLLASLFFIPAPHPKLGVDFPVLIPGWTLNYEMAFYGLFAGTLFAPHHLRPFLALASLLGIVGAGWAGLPVPAFYANPIVLEFGFGILVGMAYLKGVRLAPGLSLILIILGFVLLIGLEPLDVPRFLKAGMPSLLIVAACALTQPAPRRRPASIPLLLGDSSYSLYLTQAISLPAIAKLSAALGVSATNVGSVPYVALLTLMATLTGVACFKMLEKPLLDMTTQVSRRPKPSVSSW